MTDMHQMAAEVADHIPNDATINSKEDAVRQVLEAAIDAGWRSPG